MAAQVRYPWLVVTAEAWPFVSELAFERGITELAEDAPGILEARTQALSDDLERWLSPRAHGLSLASLRQFRDLAWFGAAPTWPRRVALDEHLSQLLSRYLCWSGARIHLNTDSSGNPPERARRYRWLSLMLPNDLMAATIAHAAQGQLHDAEIELCTPHLLDLLSRPVAETHYHVGAALRFGELWSGLMRRLAREGPLVRETTGAPPYGQQFDRRLLQAAITRWSLAMFLSAKRRGTGSPGLGLAAWMRAWLPQWSARVGGPGLRVPLCAAVAGCFSFFLTGLESQVATARLRLAYQKITRRDPRPPESIQELIEQDPLHGWSPEPAASAEVGLMLAGLRYIAAARSSGTPDLAFQRVFWQYQRVRCATFRYLTQEPGTGGLDWFQTYYDRIATLRGPLKALAFSSALRVDSRSAALAASEPRTTPDPSWYLVRDHVRLIARQALAHVPGPGRERVEVGLIYHFVKARERGSGRFKRMHADPADRAYSCRFGAWYVEAFAQAQAIEMALQRNPELSIVLRGIDVASSELAMPTWPFLPLISRVRAASRRTAQTLSLRLPELGVPALRVTLHAGEDFRRLVEGLRRMHEPIEFGIMQAGDRFGHGLALGTEPQRWAQACRLVAQPREERLEDLLWELARYGRGDLPADAGRIERVRAEIGEHGTTIYAGGYTPGDLLRARELRHQPAWLDYFNYPRFRPRRLDRSAQAAMACLQEYLHDPQVFQRGQEVIEVRTDAAEVQMLEHAQRWLRRQLGRLEITIEANPSSNLVIGDLSDLEDHPIFRLMPLQTNAEDVSLPVSINVDNPITFSSCLADEFAHTYFALLRGGVASETALSWLERARQAGYRSRFTLPCSRDEEVLRAICETWQPRSRARRRLPPARQGSARSSMIR